MRRVLLVLFAATVVAQDREALVEVSYTVDVTDAAAGAVKVEMRVTNLACDEAFVAIPAWSPGDYKLQYFGKDIADVSARDDKGALTVTAVDQQTWAVKTSGTRSFTVNYVAKKSKELFNAEHCNVQGPSTFMYVVDRGRARQVPCQVTFRLPDGWKVATGLERAGSSYRARDYDTFIDCPVELGKFEPLTFSYRGTAYQVVVHGPPATDELMNGIRKVVKAEVDLYDGAPFDRYVFIIHVGDSYDGLEHLNSTNVGITPEQLKEDVVSAISMVAHEFFHAWNVKRLRPKELGPFDYSKDVRTSMLWFCEGVTSYYTDLTLYRSGVTDRGHYLKSMAGEVELHQNNADHVETSVERASWTVWDPKAPPRLDYYNKGELLGLLLDLQIRNATDNKRSLDDVMTFLYRWFVQGGRGPIGEGYDERDILRGVNSISGRDFTSFFQKYVSGTADLAFAETFACAGLKLELKDIEVSRLGVYGWPVIDQVERKSPAERAGLKPKDKILKIDGTEITAENFLQVVRALPRDADAKVLVQREGQSVELKLRPALRKEVRATLTEDGGASEKAKRIRESWLGRP